MPRFFGHTVKNARHIHPLRSQVCDKWGALSQKCDFGTREGFWKGKSVILPFSRVGSCDFGVSLSFECALRKSLDNFGRSSVILWKRESS